MEIENPVIKLCIESTQAEFKGRNSDALALVTRAWHLAGKHYEACIAAHYIARYQTDPHEIFNWNKEALDRADKVNDERMSEFYPSLYVNMGHAHELLGNTGEAQRFYQLAADLGLKHEE